MQGAEHNDSKNCKDTNRRGNTARAWADAAGTAYPAMATQTQAARDVTRAAGAVTCALAVPTHVPRDPTGAAGGGQFNDSHMLQETLPARQALSPARWPVRHGVRPGARRGSGPLRCPLPARPVPRVNEKLAVFAAVLHLSVCPQLATCTAD